MSDTVSDPYSLLGLAPDADEDAIDAAYRRERARVVSHYASAEDLTEGAGDMEGQLQALDDAYARLKSSRRAAATATVPMVRPDLTLAQTGQHVCPRCGAANPPQALACLRCGEQFSRSCPHCRWPVAIGAQICDRCGAVVKEYDQRLFQEAETVRQRTAEERQISAVRVEQLEEYHRTRAWHGAIFWIVAFLLGCGVLILALAVIANGSR